MFNSRTVTALLLLTVVATSTASRDAFEKLTGYDFEGMTYYTVQNLSLWECQGWCREEMECAAASFSAIPNPLAPILDTLCLLQNETKGSDPDVQPSRAKGVYYFIKLPVRSSNVCNRPWHFERTPNKRLPGSNRPPTFAKSKNDCLALCLNERSFKCRSVNYDYGEMQCYMNDQDRRTVDAAVTLVEARGVDYFENLCLKADESCPNKRSYETKTFSMTQKRVAQYVGTHFYTDKELMANSVAACQKACDMEDEFLCRSLLYRGPPTPDSYNCYLYHLDSVTLPDGAMTFSTPDRPLLDDGGRIGTYYETKCDMGASISGGSGEEGDEEFTTFSPDLGTGTAGGNSGNVNCDSTGVCYDVSVHCKDTRIAVEVKTNRPFNGRLYAMGRSETCNIAVINSDKFRLDLTMGGQDCNTQSANGVFINTVVIQHHSVVMTKTDKIYKIRCTYDMSPKNITFGMMPIRDHDMIPVTSAPEAPPPRIRILDAAGKEVETVRIGDRLTFQIEITDASIYGIFARSCVAMAKDSRSTFAITDDDGCPVEPAIFPQFERVNSVLQSKYDAFRFTESYGVIFQCNVKYCLGPCPPVNCTHGRDRVQAWGRKKRFARALGRGHIQETTKEDALAAAAGADLNSATVVDDKNGKEEMSISQEILVLDLGDEIAGHYKNDPRLPVDSDPYYTNAESREHYEGATKVDLFETCPTRSSVLALAVTCAILLLIYVLTVFYFVMKKWMKPVKSLR